MWFSLFSLFAAAGSAHGDIVLLGSVKDNTLYQVSGPPVSNGAGQHMFAGRTSAGDRRRALIQFDIVSALPPGAVITNVTLTLLMSQTSTGTRTVSLRRVLADWGEGSSDSDIIQGGGQGAPATPGDATWVDRYFEQTPWGTAGGDLAAVASASTNVGGYGFYNWSSPAMAANVQDWLNNPATNFGWALVGNETLTHTTKRFETRESKLESDRPVLTITYTPEPAALGLLLMPAILIRRSTRRVLR